MKKILFALLTSLFAANLCALPVLNPGLTVLSDKHLFVNECGQVWALKVGYRGDFIYDRKLKNKLVNDVERFSVFANEGVLTLNVWERIDLYGFIGSSHFNFQSVQSSLGLNINSRALLVWGGGLRATIWEHCFGKFGTTYIGIEGQYEKMPRRSFDRASINGVLTPTPGLGYRYRETQVSIAIAHKVGFLSPYIGFKWSGAKVQIGQVTAFGTTTLYHLKSRNNYGMALGMTLIDKGYMTVTAEYRFIDESALSVFGEFRF